MTVIEASDDTTPRRSRRRQLVAVLVVVALVATAVVAVVLLRNRRQEPFADQRTSMTGRELRALLGSAVAAERTGRMQYAATPLTTDSTATNSTVDFELGGPDVDAVIADEKGRDVIVKRGVMALRDVSYVVSLAEARSADPPSERDGLPLVLAELLQTWTFQAEGRGALQQISPDAVYTRASTSGDGTSVWTSSWTTPSRRDSRVVVDAAGLPVEMRLAEAKGGEYSLPARVTVLTYSRWGQPVQIPEPTPFTGPPPQPPDPSAPVTPTGSPP